MANENNSSTITDYELDQLKEVINIGASHASTALSQMVGKMVSISVPEVMVDAAENISRTIGKEKEVITGVLLKILGEVPGYFMFIFSHDKSTSDFISLVTKKQKTPEKTLNEFDISVLKEVGNILGGAALSAFSKFLNISMIQSVSESVTDMLGSVINTLVAEISQDGGDILMFKVSFGVISENINTTFYFIIDPKASRKILQSTEQKINK